MAKLRRGAYQVLDLVLELGQMMGHDKNFREWNVNVISLLFISVKREISEQQFSPFSVILSEKIVNFSRIFHLKSENT